MGWFDSHSIDAGIRKMALIADGTVGDMGEYSCLNDAIAAGWTKIFLGIGAYMDDNIVITNHGVWIVSVQHRRNIDLGNYRIIITGHNITLCGFTLNGSNANIDIQGSRSMLSNLQISNGSGDGIYLHAGFDTHRIFNCELHDNGQHGLAFASTDRIIAVGNEIIDNTNYGISGGGIYNIAIGNDLRGNGSGGTNLSGSGIANNLT